MILIWNSHVVVSCLLFWGYVARNSMLWCRSGYPCAYNDARSQDVIQLLNWVWGIWGGNLYHSHWAVLFWGFQAGYYICTVPLQACSSYVLPICDMDLIWMKPTIFQWKCLVKIQSQLIMQRWQAEVLLDAVPRVLAPCKFRIASVLIPAVVLHRFCLFRPKLPAWQCVFQWTKEARNLCGFSISELLMILQPSHWITYCPWGWPHLPWWWEDHLCTDLCRGQQSFSRIGWVCCCDREPNCRDQSWFN